MSKRSGLGQYLFVGGIDISGDVGSIDRVSSPVGMQDVTDITQSAVARAALLASGEIAFKMFNDVAAGVPGAEYTALRGLPTTDQLVLYCMAALAGDPCFALSAKQVNYDWNRAASGALEGSCQCLGSAGVPLEPGVMLTAGKVTHASATSSASVNNLASSAYGCALFLQYFGRTSGTATILVEHATDNATWVTLATFAKAGDATPGAERKTVAVATTIRQYARVTTTGTFVNAILAVGIRRGTAQDRVPYTA